MKSLRQLILLFESSGNISKMVSYEPRPSSPSPSLSSLPMVQEITIDMEEDVQEDDFHVEEVTVTASSSPPLPPPPATADTSEPKKPLSRNRKLYQCPTCDKLLANETFYREHLSLHAAREWRAKERYICEYCAKESLTKSHHQMHMTIHSNEKPYECDQCPARFARKQGLRRHTMTHTGEKPYVCTYCGAAFSAYMSHQMHVRRHTGERPHACRHCGEKFIGLPSLNVSRSSRDSRFCLFNLSPLQLHLKTHAGEYLFQCGICKNRFKTDKTMTEHIQKKHGVEFETQQIVYTMGDVSDGRE